MIHCTYGKLNKQISHLPLTIKQIRIVIFNNILLDDNKS